MVVQPTHWCDRTWGSTKTGFHLENIYQPTYLAGIVYLALFGNSHLPNHNFRVIGVRISSEFDTIIPLPLSLATISTRSSSCRFMLKPDHPMVCVWGSMGISTNGVPRNCYVKVCGRLFIWIYRSQRSLTTVINRCNLLSDYDWRL